MLIINSFMFMIVSITTRIKTSAATSTRQASAFMIVSITTRIKTVLQRLNEIDLEFMIVTITTRQKKSGNISAVGFMCLYTY